MIELDDDVIEKMFAKAFTKHGGPIEECFCGRMHVCVDSCNMQEEGDDEIIENFKKTAQYNAAIVLEERYDSIDVCVVDGQNFVYGCGCQNYKKYTNFILEHRHEIKNFLLDWSAEVKRMADYEKTLDSIKNADG